MHRPKRRRAILKRRQARSGRDHAPAVVGAAPTPSPAKLSRFRTAWPPTLIILAAGLLTVYLVWPVFGGFFIGEDLGSRGWLLRDPAGRVWNSITNPELPFWRPAITAWFVLSDLLLPLDVTAYHIRNLALTLACVVLLYLLMERLVDWVWARALGLAWFAVSKVHFTTVGCVEMVDSIATLLHLLLALYLFVVHLGSGRKLHLWWSGVFFLLALYSRDYTAVLLPVMAVFALAVLRASGGFSWRVLARRMLPFAGLTLVYAGTRLLATRRVGIPSGGNYAPKLDLAQVLAHARSAAADLLNLSFDKPWVHGSGSFASLFGLAPARAWVLLFLAAALAAVVVTFAPALRRDARPWAGLFLAAAFIAPTFLVELAHTYYMLVPMAGMGIALAAAVQAWRPPARGVIAAVWTLILALCLLNAVAMRRTVPDLWWYSAGSAARAAHDSMIVKEKGRPVDSLTLLVADHGRTSHWRWVLDPFGGAGLVQVLSDSPDLRFQVADLSAANVQRHSGPRSSVYMVRDGIFWRIAPIAIRTARPLEIKAGAGLPGDRPAILLEMENATPGCVCRLGERTLPSRVAGPGSMSCDIPLDLRLTPATYRLRVEDPMTGLGSNSLEFAVTR